MPGPAIVVRNVSKRYRQARSRGQRVGRGLRSLVGSLGSLVGQRSDASNREAFLALNDVSFTIQRGEKVGIIGRNGAGKSTLLKIISRVIYPTAGEVVIRGRLTSLLELGTGFNSDLSGRENVYLNASLNGLRDAEIRARFDAIVDFAELWPFIDLPVKQYSSGMQMRLAFAVAVHLEPDILILDEVLTVGDEGFQKKCFRRIEELMARHRTLLFVSHSTEGIQSFCDRSIWLDEGRLRADGPTQIVVEAYLASIATDDPAPDDSPTMPADDAEVEHIPATDQSADGDAGTATEPPVPAPPPKPKRDWFGDDVGPLFDAAYYLEQNPDVAAAGLHPVNHYITWGASEGRDPHPLFDTSFYLEQNPDVAAAGANPLAHYVNWGTAEGRDPHPLFDTSFYLERNPDVAAAGLNALVHYVTVGADQGRRPHPLLDASIHAVD